MATLINLKIDDTGFFRVSNGTTVQRPTAATGLTRYNTSTGYTEVYNGSSWYSGIGSSPLKPAASAQAIYEANGSSATFPSGIYYIRRPNGDVFPVFCRFDASGGWMNLNRAWGTYGIVLTAGSRANAGWGGNHLGTDAVIKGATEPINGPAINNRQATNYGCGGDTDLSYVDWTAAGLTVKSDFSITRIRFRFLHITDNGNVVCGNIGANLGSIVYLNGTVANNISVCNNTPNRWSDLNPAQLIIEAYGTLSNNSIIWEARTACAGEMTGALLELFMQ
jgi:hypothetical protein